MRRETSLMLQLVTVAASREAGAAADIDWPG
jgi:hypothetical protein